MIPMSESVVEVMQARALCKEGNNATHEDHASMNARLLVQEFVRKFSESEKKRCVMRAMLEPGRLVLKDEDQLKAAQELGRKKVPDAVHFEACVDCVRHFMTMECLEDESSRSHLVAFVLATVRHQDIPVVNLGSLPSSSGSRASGRIDHVKQGLTAADQEIQNSSYFRSHVSRIGPDPAGPVFLLEVQDDTKLNEGVWTLATEMHLWLQKSGKLHGKGVVTTGKQWTFVSYEVDKKTIYVSDPLPLTEREEDVATVIGVLRSWFDDDARVGGEFFRPTEALNLF